MKPGRPLVRAVLSVLLGLGAAAMLLDGSDMTVQTGGGVGMLAGGLLAGVSGTVALYRDGRWWLPAFGAGFLFKLLVLGIGAWSASRNWWPGDPGSFALAFVAGAGWVSAWVLGPATIPRKT